MPRLALALLLLSSVPAFGGTYVVASSGDSGPGTLRQGILDANSGACASPCSIEFGPAELLLEVQSPLPPIRADHVRIGVPSSSDPYVGPPRIRIRAAAGSASDDGLRIEGADSTTLVGMSLSGFRNGLVADGARVTVIRACELSGNSANGMLVADSGAVMVTISTFSGNGANGFVSLRSSVIGIHLSRFGRGEGGALPNGGNGIVLHDTDFAEILGNVIVENAHTGVLVTGRRRDVRIEGNAFFGNGLLAIDFDGDGPTLDGAPVITTASFNRGVIRVTGTVRSTPFSTVRIQVYAVGSVDPSGHGEGQDLLNPQTLEIETGPDGIGDFVLHADVPDRYRGSPITAIATHVSNPSTGSGTTSEFSRNVVAADEELKYLVITTADGGPGSLRDAMERANADEACRTFFPCVIAFQIDAAAAADGVYTIRPRSPLPPITREGIWIDGGTQTAFGGDTNPLGPEIEINGSSCDGCNGLEIRGGDTSSIGAANHENTDAVIIRDLVINGFSGDGVRFIGGENRVSPPSRLERCYIGTDPTGTRAVPNGGSGVRIERAVATVGALFAGRFADGCLISGNAGHGIELVSGHARVVANRIGTDASGLSPLGNGGSGIVTFAPALLEGNLIAFNLERGVLIAQPGGSIVAGAIHSNGGLGIELADEAFAPDVPVIVSASAEGEKTRIRYVFDAAPPASVTQTTLLSFYIASFTDTSGRGEARDFLTSTFDAGGPSAKEIVVSANLAGKFITGAATPFDLFVFLPNGTTTEFAPSVQVTTGTCPTIAPLLLGPQPDFEATGPVTFRWSAVEGATEYRVWTMKFGDQPRISFLGTATEATVELTPGVYDWVVEARFGDCYGTQTEHRILLSGHTP